MPNRREAIGLALAGAAFRFGVTDAATTTGFNERNYAGAVVIDALGAPGGTWGLIGARTAAGGYPPCERRRAEQTLLSSG
jgi:hypothetical protein